MQPPYVVKPNNEGSSVGVYLVAEGANRPAALGDDMPEAVLVEEGKQPVQVTWIRSGQAEVSRWGAPIGEVGPGAAVGAPELARLRPSDVTVTAVTPVDAVVLHRRAFRGAWRALAGVRRRVDQLTTH